MITSTTCKNISCSRPVTWLMAMIMAIIRKEYLTIKNGRLVFTKKAGEDRNLLDGITCGLVGVPINSSTLHIIKYVCVSYVKKVIRRRPMYTNVLFSGFIISIAGLARAKFGMSVLIKSVKTSAASLFRIAGLVDCLIFANMPRFMN